MHLGTSITNHTMATSNHPLVFNHSRSLFQSQLSSALRSAIACSIVGVATAYAPMVLRHHLRFRAFSYVTTVLIVSDATMGHAIHGATLAVYATALGLLPAMLTLYMIRPVGVSMITATVAVVVSSFVAVVSDASEGLIAKRIALGQIVLVYVAAFDFQKAERSEAVLHPLPVAASTAIGVVAAVVALVVPYPRLACSEVTEKSGTYTEIAKERLRLFVSAFCTDNTSCMVASISLAKSLGRTAIKHLDSIRLLEEAMQWERPPLKFLQPNIRAPYEKLQAIETPLRGMEMALSSTNLVPSTYFPNQVHFRDHILNLQHQISTNFNGQDNDYTIDKAFQSFNDIPQNVNDLPSFFFLFCMKLLSNKSPSPKQEEKSNDNKSSRQSIWAMNLKTQKIVIALKCSLTLGLAIFLGLIFNKEAGYWSGLTVAITYAPVGESTFRLASLRAHGTAIGSIYGIFGSLISQNLMEVRLLALIPWVIFTSFLQRSRMYGQAGAMAAMLSAMIIMGRRNYGSPIMFSIDRLVETYIGLFCSIFVEILFQPTRASTLARSKLLESLQTLRECVKSSSYLAESKENEKKLRKVVHEMKKYAKQAELEPNFWFLPFSAACYNKLHTSLYKMVDYLHFMACAMEVLNQETYANEETMKMDLDQYKEIVSSSMTCLEEITEVKSLAKLEEELKKKKNCIDTEVGKGQKRANEEESEKIVVAFLEHSKEIVERIDDGVGGEMKKQLVLCFATIGFCIGGLMRETREMERAILEHMQWENPNSYIDLYEIYCKIKELST